MENIFGTIPTDSDIYNPIEPFSIRNNCQIGQFCQDDNLLGNKAQLFICNFRQFYGDLGMTTDEYWNEIFFYPVTPNLSPIVSQMFFKKAGRKIFNNLVNSIMARKINPVKGKFTTWFEKKSKALPDGTTGNYYHLNWNWESLESLPEAEVDIFEKLSGAVSGYQFPLPSEGNLILLPAKGSERDNAIAQFKREKQKQLTAAK